MRYSELILKDVVNTCSCKVLGKVCDMTIDECNGRIINIIVPEPGKLCGLFCRETEYVIPWECIKRIGDDIILVEIRNEDFCKKGIL